MLREEVKKCSVCQREIKPPREWWESVKACSDCVRRVAKEIQGSPKLKSKKSMERIKCEFCENLDDMEREYPDAPHHGAVMVCDECGAEYYEEYMGAISSTNDEAQKNHPELKRL